MTILRKIQFVKVNWFWFFYNKQKKLTEIKKSSVQVLLIVRTHKHVKFESGQCNHF